jgi:tetratricopeptide (TPR) repeat protein
MICINFSRGDIPEAILCFESAVQRDSKHVRAWQFLGRAQAENDKDDLAIAALNGAIKADPGNLDALLNLAVSYTNDFHKDKALDTLVQWMQYNPQYREVFLKFPPFDLNEDFEANHHLVTDMFIEVKK